MLKRTGKPGNEFMKKICYHDINYHIPEPDLHRQNPNKGDIPVVRQKL